MSCIMRPGAALSRDQVQEQASEDASPNSASQTAASN